MSKFKNFFSEDVPQIWLGTSVLSAQSLHILAGAALIIVATFLAYFPCLSGRFIWDDESLVTNNHLIKASDGLYRFWCTTEAIDYWPVTNTTLWFEWRLWGMNATGYHVTNLVLHIATTLLIWIILRKLSIPGAFFAALIFAIHPVNVESVAWIAQRKNTLSMLFFLLSILWYLKFEIPSSLSSHHSSASSVYCPPSTVHRPLFYWLSLAAFVLAMLSKGSVAVLPVLLLVILWWLRPLTRKDLVRTVPFFLVAVVLTGVNVWFQTRGSLEAIRTASFAQRLLGAGGVVWFYLYKALLPLNLVFIYPQWHIEVGHLLWWLPLVAAVVVTVVLWRFREGWSRPLSFAWGFFCVALLPVMGLIDVYFMKFSLVADHYQHIAIIGVIALAAALWSCWHQRTRQPATTIAAAVVCVLMYLTWQQSLMYKNDRTLYRTTIARNPGCWLAYNNLGAVFVKAGRLHEAIEHYEQALRLKPDYAKARHNLGHAMFNLGRVQEAIEQYQQALGLEPNDPELHNNLGNALAEIGRTQEALNHYEQALKLYPDYAEAHKNLGILLGKIRRLPEAIEHFQKALKIDPELPQVHNNLGIALGKVGRTQEAVEHFQQALRLDHDYTEAYANLASAYAVTGRPDKAVAAAQKALKLARSKQQTALAKQLEDWLNSYNRQNTVK